MFGSLCRSNSKWGQEMWEGGRVREWELHPAWKKALDDINLRGASHPRPDSHKKLKPGRNKEKKLKFIAEEPCFSFSLRGREGYYFSVGTGIEFSVSESEPFDMLPWFTGYDSHIKILTSILLIVYIP